MRILKIQCTMHTACILLVNKKIAPVFHQFRTSFLFSQRQLPLGILPHLSETKERDRVSILSNIEIFGSSYQVKELKTLSNINTTFIINQNQKALSKVHGPLDQGPNP
jgi:hypothetical protein